MNSPSHGQPALKNSRQPIILHQNCSSQAALSEDPVLGGVNISERINLLSLLKEKQILYFQDRTRRFSRIVTTNFIQYLEKDLICDSAAFASGGFLPESSLESLSYVR